MRSIDSVARSGIRPLSGESTVFILVNFMEPTLLEFASFEFQIQHLIGGFLVLSLADWMFENNVPLPTDW